MERYRKAQRRGLPRASKSTRYTKLVILATTLMVLLLMHLQWITLDSTGFGVSYEYSTWSLITAILNGYLPIVLLLLYIVRLLFRIFVLAMFISTLALLVRRDARYKKRFVLACLGMVLVFALTFFLVLAWNKLPLSAVIVDKIGRKPFALTFPAFACCALSVLMPFAVMPLLRRIR